MFVLLQNIFHKAVTWQKIVDKGWNPYLSGALSGFVSIFSVWLSGQFLGASTTFVRGAGAIEKYINPEKLKSLDYFVKIPPIMDCQAMFIIGIFIGSLIAAITSGSFYLKGVPDMWESRFGKSWLKRGFFAFMGGTIAMFGARLADG